MTITERCGVDTKVANRFASFGLYEKFKYFFDILQPSDYLPPDAFPDLQELAWSTEPTIIPDVQYHEIHDAGYYIY